MSRSISNVAITSTDSVAGMNAQTYLPSRSELPLTLTLTLTLTLDGADRGQGIKAEAELK